MSVAVKEVRSLGRLMARDYGPTALPNPGRGLEEEMQHDLADLGTWEEVEYELVYTKMDRHCGHDRFLAALCETVKREAERKMEAGNVDLASIRRRVGRGC